MAGKVGNKKIIGIWKCELLLALVIGQAEVSPIYLNVLFWCWSRTNFELQSFQILTNAVSTRVRLHLVALNIISFHYFSQHKYTIQYHVFLKCQLFHLTTLQVSFSRVLWKLKFLLSPSRSLQRKSYNCNTLLRKRDWITTKQNSLSYLFKPYQTWMKSHTSTHCGPIFINWCYNHGIKKLPNYWWTRWHHFRDTIGCHSNNMTS